MAVSKTKARTRKDRLDDEEICPKTGGEHMPDLTALSVPADCAGVVDVPCINCGRSGSVAIVADEINW